MLSLLSRVGLSLLELVNEKGQTPMDIGSGKGSAHYSTSMVFKYALEQKAKGYKTLQPPRGLWFWYLFMPLIFFTAGGLLVEVAQAIFGW